MDAKLEKQLQLSLAISQLPYSQQRALQPFIKKLFGEKPKTKNYSHSDFNNIVGTLEGNVYKDDAQKRQAATDYANIAYPGYNQDQFNQFLDFKYPLPKPLEPPPDHVNQPSRELLESPENPNVLNNKLPFINPGYKDVLQNQQNEAREQANQQVIQQQAQAGIPTANTEAVMNVNKPTNFDPKTILNPSLPGIVENTPVNDPRSILANAVHNNNHPRPHFKPDDGVTTKQEQFNEMITKRPTPKRTESPKFLQDIQNRIKSEIFASTPPINNQPSRELLESPENNPQNIKFKAMEMQGIDTAPLKEALGIQEKPAFNDDKNKSETPTPKKLEIVPDKLGLERHLPDWAKTQPKKLETEIPVVTKKLQKPISTGKPVKVIIGAGLAVKNNNPGNLKSAKTGKFRTFKTPEEGYQALLDDIEIKQSGRSKTGIKADSSLADYIKVYAPESDNNDTETYIKNMVEFTGFPADTPISKIPKDVLGRAIVRQESNTKIQ